MKEDIKDYRDFFTTYATGNTYSFREAQQNRTIGNQSQRESGKKLPIIYDTEARNSTPTKQPGSSRVVYGDREKSQKQIISSHVIKYDSTPFSQLREEPRSIQQHKYEQINRSQPYMNQVIGLNSLPIQKMVPASSLPIQSLQLSEPASSRSRTIIGNLEQSRPATMQINSSFQPTQKVQITLKERKQIKQQHIAQIGGTGRFERISEGPPPMLPSLLGNNIIKSYVTSEVVQAPIPEFGNLHNHNFAPQNNLPTMPPQRDISSNYVSQSQSQSQLQSQQGLAFSRPPAPNPSNKQKQLMKVEIPSEPKQSVRQMGNNEFMMVGSNQNSVMSRGFVQGVSHLSTETVPKLEYDKCVNECKNWETKYNQLYLKYMNLASSMTQQTNEVELNGLRQENGRLKQQLRQQQQKMKSMMPLLESKFIEMVENQREATVKQTMLLVERFKLQSRQNQR